MPTDLQTMALRAVADADRNGPSEHKVMATVLLRERDGKTRQLTEYVQAVNWALGQSPTEPNGYEQLLAAYRAEVNASVEPLTVAQNLAERLAADNLFGRLAGLRDELQARLDDDDRDRQLAVEHAIDVLGAIVGEA